VPYQQTEVYRFGNPIVDAWEGKVNAWPLDEGRSTTLTPATAAPPTCSRKTNGPGARRNPALAARRAGGRRPHLDVVPRTADEAARIADVTAPPEDFSQAEPFEARPGGAATANKRIDANAFSHSSANMAFESERDFKVGKGLFRKL